MTLTDCTISGNSASGGGGLSIYGGTAAFEACTISANTGGGLYVNSGQVALTDTIVAGNTTSHGKASDLVKSGSNTTVTGTYDLIGTGGSGGLVNGQSGNLVGVANPGLGSLGNHGGPTQTMDLLAGSPAIGAGTTLAGLSTDQRGLPRPTTGAVDIGAVEDEVAVTAPASWSTFIAGISDSVALGSFADAVVATPYQVSVGWGDGSSPTTFAPNSTGALGSSPHTFADHGTYTVAVTVTDANGDQSGYIQTATVNPEPTDATLTSSIDSPEYGQTVTFTEQVTPAQEGISLIPTGTVQFQVDGSNDQSPVALNSSGAAEIALSSLDSGTHTITATYSNSDGNFTPPSTSQTISVTVQGQTTTTGLTISPPAPVFGQTVTFTATVTASGGSGTPSGTVSFEDSGSVLGSATLSNGTAVFTSSSLAVGTHSIEANYGATSTFGGSSSSLQSLTVAVAPSTTDLSSSAATSTYGNAITLTATTTTAAGLVTSGTVTFAQGSTTLGTATNWNANGQATLSLTTLPAGTDAIVASYSGSGGNILGSSLTATSIVVAAAPLTVTAAASPPSTAHRCRCSPARSPAW